MKLWLASLLSLAPFGASTNTNLEPFSNVGKCRYKNISNDPCFDLKEYLSARFYWIFNSVPNAPNEERLEWAFLRNTPTNESGMFSTQIYGQQSGEDVTKYVDEVGQMDENGTIFLNPIGSSIKIKLFFLHYSPTCVLYYACSDDSDYDVDSRFVLTPGCGPTQVDRNRIQKIEEDYQFKGEIKYLLH